MAGMVLCVFRRAVDEVSAKEEGVSLTGAERKSTFSSLTNRPEAEPWEIIFEAGRLFLKPTTSIRKFIN